MKVIEPKVTRAMEKINAINSMPSPAAIKASESETQQMMKNIDMASNGNVRISSIDAGSTAQ